MLFLSKDDYYEVYMKSIVSDYDKETLTMLYQPIIGASAVSLYLSLCAEYSKSKNKDAFNTHEDLVSYTGISIGDMQEARRKLEAIGLIQTYYKEEKKTGFYKYLIYAPLTPKEFFDDILYKGLLIEKIGEKKVQELIRKYKEKPLSLEGFNEISESFKNVFNPNLDSDSYTKENITGGYGRKGIDITKGFDSSAFLKALEENYHILSKNIKKAEIKKLSEIALLYGINELTFADLVSQCYHPENKDHIDYERLKNLSIEEKTFVSIRTNHQRPIAYDTDSKIGKKIEMLSSLSAIDFLRLKQKNTMVSPSDVKLINDLNEKYGLKSNIINCIIDYTLQKNNNTLSKNYVTKIAASVVREGITDTLECMNYLTTAFKKKSYSTDMGKQETKITDETKANDTNNNSSDDVNLSELLDDIDNL